MKQDYIEKIRGFNRYYTMKLGVLNRRYLGGRLSLPETRVIRAVGRGQGCNAARVARELNIDKGYMSRLLRGLEVAGLVERVPSMSDRRCGELRLTPAGVSTLEEIDRVASRWVEELCDGLDEARVEELIECMDRINDILERKDSSVMEDVEIVRFSHPYADCDFFMLDVDEEARHDGV